MDRLIIQRQGTPMALKGRGLCLHSSPVLPPSAMKMSLAWVRTTWVGVLQEGLPGPQWTSLDPPLHLAWTSGLTDVVILIPEGT